MAIDAGLREARGWRRAGRERPLVVAHRGASRWELENTIAAFALAAAQGADGVELDVLLCASGEVVVFHDDDLARLAGRPERVESLSLSALRKVVLDPRGARLRPAASTPAIPTLPEALTACGPQLLVNVELKSAGLFDASLARLVAGVSDVVDLAGAASRVIVSSFDPRAVALWRQHRPDVPFALLMEKGGIGAFAKAMTLPLLAPSAVHPESVFCRPDLVDAWHAGGYLVNTWTVDDPAQLRALAAAGVDGLITNDPAGALAALSGYETGQ
jgi:glycerophosphoryl diester phosphodiesterase